MISEVTSILAVMGGTTTALVQMHRQPTSLRKLLFALLIAGLANLGVLSVSGVLRNGDDIFAAIHAMTGHLMLPLVAFASGLWLGASSSGVWRRPLYAFPRMLFLLVLGFWCLSNTWTGYFGPSRLDPQVAPETNLRFEIIHQWATPVLIGSMLLFWLYHLFARQSGAANAEIAEKAAPSDRPRK